MRYGLDALTQKYGSGLLGIVGNAGWLFFERALRMVLGFSVGIWVARYLGPGQFGLLSYSIAFVDLFGAIAALGLDSLVVRDLVRDPSRKYEILGTTFALKALGGLTAVLMVLGAVLLLNPDDSLIRWLVAILAVGAVFRAFDTIDFWFQSRVRSKYAVIARSTAVLLVAALRVGLIWLEAPLIAFAWASLAEALLVALGLALVYRHDGQHLLVWRVGVGRGKALLSQSWPLILSGLAVLVYMRIDQIMLREMVGDQAVGVYSAALRISEAWYIIPVAVVSSVFPSIIRAKETSESLYYRRLEQLFGFMAGIGIAIALPMTFLSGPLVLLLFGERYQAAGSILAIHIWAAIFVFYGVVQSSWFINEGLTRLSLTRTAAGALVNVALNLVLIPAYGGVGAAIATVISYAIAAFLMNVISARTRRIFYLQVRSFLFFRYLYP